LESILFSKVEFEFIKRTDGSKIDLLSSNEELFMGIVKWQKLFFSQITYV
jgi:hypothetical protein